MMKKYTVLLFALLASHFAQAQNVGIGTTTPRGPLSFPSTNGQKIILWDDGNAAGNNYGIGIQTGTLQVNTYTKNDDIVFGYGKSTAFNERMRVINTGDAGLSLNGRIYLSNGTLPLDANYGPGISLSNANNTTQLAFIGTQNNQNIGFFGGPAGWGFTYNALNSRVGIGNNNPNAPLSFPATLEKKITLYPGATGDVGFAVAGNRLQIYADNPNADVAIGYDAAGTFNERFAVKANGALAVNGNTGAAGQVLQSNGSGSAATWVTAPGSSFNNTYSFGLTTGITTSPSAALYDLPGLNQDITLTSTSKVLVSIHAAGYANSCFACGESVMEFRLYIDNADINNYFQYKSAYVANASSFDLDTGLRMLTLGPGVHNFKMLAKHNLGPQVNVYAAGKPFETRMVIMVVPQ